METLNLSGNLIGDEGAIVIAQALQTPKCKIKTLDLGLNEISSRGFQVLCDALPHTKIEAFACGKNLLNENNIIKHFCKVLPRTHLA